MNNDNSPVTGERLLRASEEEEDRQRPNRSEGILGDKCKGKGGDCLRLMSQNINGIGQEMNSIKEQGIKNMGGCRSIEWARVQEDYYKWLNIRRTGERWATELIKKLWDISWDLWQDRNRKIHNTQMESILRGVDSLDKAIQEEDQLGKDGLPKPVQDNFLDDINEILSSPLN